MSHARVIPRDFFNESKLLKCLGHLELFLMENPRANILKMHSEFDHEPFRIVQDSSDGSLSVSNYKVFIGDEELRVFSNYNDKSAFPLCGEFRGEIYYLFDDNGKFMPNFGVEK